MVQPKIQYQTGPRAGQQLASAVASLLSLLNQRWHRAETSGPRDDVCRVCGWPVDNHARAGGR